MAFNFDGNYQAGLDPALIAYYNAQNQAYTADPRAYAASVGFDPFSLAYNSNGKLGVDLGNGYKLVTIPGAASAGHYEGDQWVPGTPGAAGYQIRNTKTNTGANFDANGKYLGDFNANKDDMADLGVMALVGGAFAGVAAGAAAAGSGAGAAAGGVGEAAPAVSSVGAGGTGASFGLSPSVLTTPTLAEGAGVTGGSSLAGGAGLTSTASSGGLFANPAMWSGAVPSGVGYGIAPSLSLGASVGGASVPNVPGAPAGGGGGGGSGGSGGTAGPGGTGSGGFSLYNPDGSVNWGSLAKLGVSGLGALAGSQGVNQSATSTRTMDPRLDPYVYGALLPSATGLLGSQMPIAVQDQQALQKQGMGLLNTPTTPDIYGSTFYKGAADDLGRRTQNLLNTNNLAIQSNSVATGGLGGSRQGVAQGIAAGQAADSLQGNLSQLALGQYNQDSTRALQAQTLGAGMLSQGLSAPWTPIQQTTQTISPFTGFGTTTAAGTQGGGTMGAVGGAIGAYGVGKQMGWW